MHFRQLMELGRIIFNPAGYSHTSVAPADTIAAVSTPVVEVHIPVTFTPGAFRQQSLTAGNNRSHRRIRTGRLPTCRGIV